MTPRCTPAAVLVSLLALGTTGCATMVPFTHEMRVEHDLSDDEVSQLQFYTSHDIKLRREVKSKGRRIDDGTLKLRSGTRVEEVFIPANTPGVVVSVDPGSIEVSFERGTSMRFVVGDEGPSQPLVMESSGGFAKPPSAFPGDEGRVADVLDDVLGSYFVSTQSGQLPFRGLLWDPEGETLQAHLMIDASTLEEVVEERTTLGGRRL